MCSAALTAWARVENFKRDAVERALWRDRTLVKTWAMRCTLHLLPAKELPLWHAALGTSRRFLKPVLWKKYYGITMELDRVTEVIGAALKGRLMTREELAREVARLTGSLELGTKLAARSWGTMLRPAAFTARLCFGPSVGQKVRFTRPDTWLARGRQRLGPAVDSQAALADITRRFLAAYCPTTYHDLARWWNGGGVSTARQWITLLSDEVCHVEVEGMQAWMLARDARELRELQPIRSVRLLPGFDQFVIGASWHAWHLLPGDLQMRVYRPQGWLSPVLLVNGRMMGTWRHDIKGRRVMVEVEPFIEVPQWVRRAAGQEAERLGGFFACSASMVWKS